MGDVRGPSNLSEYVDQDYHCHTRKHTVLTSILEGVETRHLREEKKLDLVWWETSLPLHKGVSLPSLLGDILRRLFVPYKRAHGSLV